MTLYKRMMPARIRDAISIFGRDRGYLADTGWVRSRIEHMSVDQHGDPLPWITYPAMQFLSDRVGNDAQVFEYGSGNSTLWWAKRVARVTAVEHDESWYRKIKAQLPANARILWRAVDEDDYVAACSEPAAKPTIVVIDGRRRVACAQATVAALASNGVIVWDNSDRERYREGYDYLSDAGFRSVDFWGLLPINFEMSCTTIFYRDANCLAL